MFAINNIVYDEDEIEAVIEVKPRVDFKKIEAERLALLKLHLSSEQYQSIINNRTHIAHVVFEYYRLKKASGLERIV